jgi:YD repeat-containing protein
MRPSNYDKIGRLTNETTNGTSSMTMTYNAIGKIASKTVGGSTFTYSYRGKPRGQTFILDNVKNEGLTPYPHKQVS